MADDLIPSVRTERLAGLLAGLEAKAKRDVSAIVPGDILWLIGMVREAHGLSHKRGGR